MASHAGQPTRTRGSLANGRTVEGAWKTEKSHTHKKIAQKITSSTQFELRPSPPIFRGCMVCTRVCYLPRLGRAPTKTKRGDPKSALKQERRGRDCTDTERAKAAHAGRPACTASRALPSRERPRAQAARGLPCPFRARGPSPWRTVGQQPSHHRVCVVCAVRHHQK